MGYEVSSWFIDQVKDAASEPKRMFTIGSSDYSGRVVRWPRLRRTVNDLRSTEISIPLENTDGGMNGFYANTYTMPNTCELKVGFTHPDSGDELIGIHIGKLKKVSYSGNDCVVIIKDKLWEMSETKVGESETPVKFSARIPSEIAWTLCTCYGGQSNVSSTSNPDIDYAGFLEWAETFSKDNVQTQARYEGMKITEALTRLARMTDSAVWVEGDGKINFKRFYEASSLDIVFQDDEFEHIAIDVDGVKLINKQHVFFDYAPASDYWQKTVTEIDSPSVNSYGVYEDIKKDDSIWYVNSVDAIRFAQRILLINAEPPKQVKMATGMNGIHRQIAETIRLVDSFYAITSETSWRIAEYAYHMDNGGVDYVLDKGTAMLAFTLDVSTLDGFHALL